MKILKSKSGQGMTEYIIIVAIIAIAALAAFKIFGSKVREGIEKAGTALESSVNEGIEGSN